MSVGGGILTTRASQAKQAEREKLVKEMEDELGFAKDHPEDIAILDAPCVQAKRVRATLTRTQSRRHRESYEGEERRLDCGACDESLCRSHGLSTD